MDNVILIKLTLHPKVALYYLTLVEYVFIFAFLLSFYSLLQKVQNLENVMLYMYFLAIVASEI